MITVVLEQVGTAFLRERIDVIVVLVELNGESGARVRYAISGAFERTSCRESDCTVC